MNNCKVCGSNINNNRIYCSDRCKERFRYNNTVYIKECKICGQEFPALKGMSVCSPSCSIKAQRKHSKCCPICNREFNSRGNGEYCSESCYRTANSTTKGLTITICEVCHKDFKMLKTEPRATCSDKCSAKLFSVYISRANREVFGCNIKDEIRKMIAERRVPACKEEQVKILR